MEATVERDGSAVGALFQQIITDMKAGTPLWEDFLSKASKLHTVLKSALSFIGAYLEAFQKIADAASSSKGATKEIGTVLTRICLRHKAVESRLKTFISALMDCLVNPLNDKLDEWKKNTINLDKEHAKESKKLRADIKKRSGEVSRWQKKAQKIRGENKQNGSGSATCLSGSQQEILRAAEAAQLDLAARVNNLHGIEKQSLRSALVEERSRYCVFTAHLQPVMNEEMAMMTELSHLEDLLVQLNKHTAEPYVLPASSEQMISELKSCSDVGSWTVQTPPSSPASLGSRKSSMCSLASMSSSSSSVVNCAGSVQHQSPCRLPPAQHLRHRSLQAVNALASGGSVRLSSVSSQDSGFLSQDTLVLRPASPPASAPVPEKNLEFECTSSNPMNERPHTISTAYEKGHQRPALSVYTFQPLESSQETLESTSPRPAKSSASCSRESLIYSSVKPPPPERCSSLERPHVPVKPKLASRDKETRKKSTSSLNSDSGTPVTLPDFHQSVPDMVVPQPVYMNANDLRCQDTKSCDYMEDQESSSSAIYSSLSTSSGYGSHYHEDNTHACSCSNCNQWPTRPQIVVSRPTLRRPASFAGYADPSVVGARESWSNPSPAHGPPVKRSSLSSFATLHEVTNDDAASIDPFDLPPPPAFLLDAHPHPEEELKGHSSQSVSPNTLSVAAAVKSLTAIGHQPVSPVMLRRVQSMRIGASTAHPPADWSSARSKVKAEGQEVVYGTAERLHIREEPKHRRCSESEAQDVRQRNGHPPPPLPPPPYHREPLSEPRLVSGLLTQSGFIHSLNATLAKQQETPRENDGVIPHQGVSVRRSRTINERSGPRI